MPDAQDNARPRTRAFDLHIMRIGEGHVAVASVAGINVRSNRARSADGAVRDLFNQLAQEHNINAGLGIDLALEGQTYADVAGDLPAIES